MKKDKNKLKKENDMKVIFSLIELGKFENAIKLCEEILEVNPQCKDCLRIIIMINMQSKKWHESVDLINKLINIENNNAVNYNLKGVILYAMNENSNAIQNFEKAIEIKFDYSEAYYNLGLVLQKLNKFKDAINSYSKAINFTNNYSEAYNNIGNCFLEIKSIENALKYFNKAIELNKDFSQAYFNRALALKELNYIDEAIKNYDKALNINNNFAEAYNNKGNLLIDLKMVKEAYVCLEKAFKIDPTIKFLFGQLIFTKMQMCDWTNFELQVEKLKENIYKNNKVSTCLTVLALIDSPEIQKKSAEIWTNYKYPTKPLLEPIIKNNNLKIKLGYYSSDFHNHATSILINELFKLHDKSKFELIAFSYGPKIDDDMRKQLIKDFDIFNDVHNNTDEEIAIMSRQMNIDIAIDLKGITKNERMGIFSHRAAPIQVNYLGYPGTTGTNYIEYIMADKIVITTDTEKFYSEKIIYLPDSYQVNDRKRERDNQIVNKQEYGLPDNSFVFCCFNNSYKINPFIFDVWMKLLKSIDGSVLWLLEDNQSAVFNLQNEAKKRGVSSDRLIFAKRMHNLDHLKRHAAADLFLDTFPCNAHTTASDALWAGLPLLTIKGESFASRVAASLLNAIKLPELITDSIDNYAKLAIELAEDPTRLGHIKEKLDKNILSTPLFDSKLFTLNIEKAYLKIYSRYQNNLEPENIII